MTLAAEMEYRHLGATPVCAGHDHGSAAQRDRFMAAALWLFHTRCTVQLSCVQRSCPTPTWSTHRSAISPPPRTRGHAALAGSVK